VNHARVAAENRASGSFVARAATRSSYNVKCLFSDWGIHG
jgi:hypothetical protein